MSIHFCVLFVKTVYILWQKSYIVVAVYRTGNNTAERLLNYEKKRILDVGYGHAYCADCAGGMLRQR